MTIRDVIERPETIECGSNILSRADPEIMLLAVKIILSFASDWSPPVEYTASDVSRTVAKIILGYTGIRQHKDN